MLGIFKSGVVNPPKELHSPASSAQPKPSHQILNDFLASNAFSLGFADKGFFAYAPSPQRMFCGLNDVYCIFIGGLNNLCTLNKQYGLSKCGNEAMFMIEAYCTLRDRGPIPAHQVLQEFEGNFAFLLYDHKYGTVFLANGGVSLMWGISSDENVIISDSVEVMKASCGKSFAAFPNGCMYHNESGLKSFQHPKKMMKAMPRVDSEGVMCGANFAVDAYSKINTIPRVGSQANWATWS